MALTFAGKFWAVYAAALAAIVASCTPAPATASPVGQEGPETALQGANGPAPSLPYVDALPARPGAPMTVGVHLGSWHDKPGYNNTNPGLYIKRGDWAVGAYRNSIRRTSFYVAHVLSKDVADNVEVSLSTGVVTGYDIKVAPLVVPSVAYRVDNWKVRLSVIPQVHEKQGASVAHLSIEMGF